MHGSMFVCRFTCQRLAKGEIFNGGKGTDKMRFLKNNPDMFPAESIKGMASKLMGGGIQDGDLS